ncbi:MAG: DUF1349 domain-containing protein [Eubacterium sp.]|nr:DUF1349 domain-containing protein [Eubacterium sp.]MBQ3412038.1 DUF1349 domain-containing protein [Oscillospiraceae bacterium]
MEFDDLKWTREPAGFSVESGRIEITTAPHTDLWQRTYYHFRNDNAPVLQKETDEKYFSFTVKTDFSGSSHRFDQCGIVMYLDSENWLKASVEYENGSFQHLGSVVTDIMISENTISGSTVSGVLPRFLVIKHHVPEVRITEPFLTAETVPVTISLRSAPSAVTIAGRYSSVYPL